MTICLLKSHTREIHSALASIATMSPPRHSRGKLSRIERSTEPEGFMCLQNACGSCASAGADRTVATIAIPKRMTSSECVIFNCQASRRKRPIDRSGSPTGFPLLIEIPRAPGARQYRTLARFAPRAEIDAADFRRGKPEVTAGFPLAGRKPAHRPLTARQACHRWTGCNSVCRHRQRPFLKFRASDSEIEKTASGGLAVAYPTSAGSSTT